MSTLKLFLFGPPRLEINGEPVNITLRKALALLIYLVVTRQNHSRDSLATLFWPDDSQSKARGNLRRALYRLNKVLGENQLDITREHVSINRESSPTVDIDNFYTCLRKCDLHGHPSEEICQVCLPLLREAAAWYTNDFMHGFSLPDCPQFDDWQFFQAEELRRALSTTLERIVYSFRSTSDYNAALPYATHWVGLDPLHEPAQSSLIELYALTGQHSAAIRQYQKYVQVLDDELGIPPGDEITALYEAILSKQIKGDSPFEEVKPPMASHKKTSRHNLPILPTQFIGRDREIEKIRTLLFNDPKHRLLTLIGPGGIGKTRLAIKAAESFYDRFEDGVFYVDFASLNDPNLVPSALAQVLGLRENVNSSIEEALTKFLASREILLLLDNFEHVNNAAPFVSSLLAASMKIQIIITSREALHVYGEQELPVPAMLFPGGDGFMSPKEITRFEAIQLFTQRAQAVKPDFLLTDENAGDVVEICSRLDGLPLAIELAAARCKLFSPKMLCKRLESRLDTLVGGARDLPARMRTLRGSIDWSFHLLDDQEKQLFSRLSVFQGGRSIEAVAAVCMEGLSCDVLQTMESLLNKSLIHREESPDGGFRFTFLESIHQYAREQLEQYNQAERFGFLHAEYYTSLAEKAEPELFKAGQANWFSSLKAERDNLRTAIIWAFDNGHTELSLKIISSLREYWYIDGQFTETLAWINRGLKYAETIPALLHTKVLNTAAYLAFGMGDYKHDFVDQALRIAGKAGDEANLAWALFFKGLILTAYPKMHAEGTIYCLEALSLFKELDDQPGISIAYNALGEFSRIQGNYEEAKRYYQKGICSSTESGNLHRKSILLENLSQIAYYHGDYEEAEKYVLEEISICRDLKINFSLASSLIIFAGLVCAKGETERAARLLSASLNIFESMGGGIQPADQPTIDLYLRSIKNQLDEATFQTVWEEGKRLTLEEAYAVALGENF
jgi:predicted ATPase/DNA-binding SARP family transcriptional activator